MKNVIILGLFAITTILTSCEGSDVYRGEWKAVNVEGLKSEITFTEDQMTLSNKDGDSGTWEYSQNSVSIENGTRSYGIKLENGLNYRITFPIKDNVERGAISDQNDRIIYLIGRNGHYSYEDVFGIR